MKIDNIKVNKILDSRGEWTIEVEIESEGTKEKASIPSGKSKGKYEAVCLDYETIQKNLTDFLKEVKNIDFQSSQEFDQFLIERAGNNKEKLGANFTLGCSIALARVLAKKEGLELFEYLNKEYQMLRTNANYSEPMRTHELPRTNANNNNNNREHTRTNEISRTDANYSEPIQTDESSHKFVVDNDKVRTNSHLSSHRFAVDDNVRISSHLSSQEFAVDNKVRISSRFCLNIIGGGVHSRNNLDFQEYWLVSKEGFSEKLIAEILSVIKILEQKLPKPLGRNDEGAFSTNFSDNYEPFIYLNQFKENFELGVDIAANQIESLVNWKRIYQKLKTLNVVYLEDPFKEDEFGYFANLKKEGFKVIGDDLTVTNIERLRIALEKNSVDGVIIKPNQIGTIKETFDFVKLAKENNLFTIFSHRSGETNDNWIIDLGIAFSADYFKIGVPLQGERISKWNGLIEIFSNVI